MGVLMMIVVEDGIGLPWLPPLCLEGDARVVDDCMVIGVQQHGIEWNCDQMYQNLMNQKSSAVLRLELTPMNGKYERWREQHQLHVHNFDGMNGGD